MKQAQVDTHKLTILDVIKEGAKLKALQTHDERMKKTKVNI